MAPAKFKVEDFPGYVVTKDWTQTPDGHAFMVFVGKVSIIRDKDAVGFEVKDRESNWIARVEGATEAWNFPGCQVRAVVASEADYVKHGNTYVVP